MVWRGIERAIRDLIILPGAQTWWRTRKHWYTDNFQNLVDEIIAKSDGLLETLNSVLVRTLCGDFGESCSRLRKWFRQCFVGLEREVFDAVVQFLFDEGPVVTYPFFDWPQRRFAHVRA
jgi:hypothetical protein